MLTIKLKVNEASLKSVLANKYKLIDHNIHTVLLNEAFTTLIDAIMLGFDSLVERAKLLPEDPTNPANWREDFKLSLEEDLYDHISIQGNRISIRMGDRDFLGYDPSEQTNDETDNSPLKWMVYYIEGLAGEWAFITPELYERFRQTAYEPTWGRFSEGFMISKDVYFEEGWDSVMPFESVKHPFSGYSPLDIFEEALREWKIRPFIEKALKAAAEGIKL